MTTAPGSATPSEPRQQREPAQGEPTDTDAAALKAAPLHLLTLTTTVVGALVIVAASRAGQGYSITATLAVALVLAWSWPTFSGSRTPQATTVVLAVSAVTIVLSALRDDLLWVASAVALGVVLSFFAALGRSGGREGLVLSLLSAFGGLALIASGTSAVAVVDSGRGRALVLVAMAAVVTALLVDLLAGVVRHTAVLAAMAVVLGLCAGGAASLRYSGAANLPLVTMLAVGAGAALLSWAFRRVLAFQPGLNHLRGRVGAGAGSLLVVGAVVNLAAGLS